MNYRTQPAANQDPDNELLLVDPLTEREEQVLALVAQGYTNGDIAVRLVVSEKTVRNHLTAVYSKLSIEGTGKSARILAALRANYLRYEGPDPDEDCCPLSAKNRPKRACRSHGCRLS